MAKAVVKCPKCGSTFIRINGLVQGEKKKLHGVFYTLGYKAALKKDAPNAICLSCNHTWIQRS